MQHRTRIRDDTRPLGRCLLSQSPGNVLPLELLFKLALVTTEEVDERQPYDLCLIAEPAPLHQSFEVLHPHNPVLDCRESHA